MQSKESPGRAEFRILLREGGRGDVRGQNNNKNLQRGRKGGGRGGGQNN